MPSRNYGTTDRRGRRKGSRKTGGRKKGTPNKATVEAKNACSEIVDDVKYRKNLLAKARKGTLPPAVECMLWHYAKGKPKESVALEAQVAVVEDSREKFLAEAREYKSKAALDAAVAAMREAREALEVKLAAIKARS